MHLRPTCVFFSRPSPLNAVFFLIKKSAAFRFFLFPDFVKPLLQPDFLVLKELENQCITHVNLLLLVLTRLNRGLTASPAFHTHWVCF